MEKNFNFWVDKWIKGECRHLCKFCKHKKQCFNERHGNDKHNRRLAEKYVNTIVELGDVIRKNEAEQRRLNGIIEDLTSDIDKAEETAYDMQEEIEELKKKLKAEKEASKELYRLYFNVKYNSLYTDSEGKPIFTVDRILDMYGTDIFEQRIKVIKECGLMPK